MPALQAEECMRMTEVVAVGTGSLKKGKGQQIMREWQSIANRGKGRQKAARLRKEDLSAALGGIGIGVRKVKRDGD